jgi:hypothetical protein
MKKPAPKPKRIRHVMGIHASPEFKAAVEQRAAAEGRSVSNWLKVVAQKELDKGRFKP